VISLIAGIRIVLMESMIRGTILMMSRIYTKLMDAYTFMSSKTFMFMFILEVKKKSTLKERIETFGVKVRENTSMSTRNKIFAVKGFKASKSIMLRMEITMRGDMVIMLLKNMEMNMKMKMKRPLMNMKYVMKKMERTLRELYSIQPGSSTGLESQCGSIARRSIHVCTRAQLWLIMKLVFMGKVRTFWMKSDLIEPKLLDKRESSVSRPNWMNLTSYLYHNGYFTAIESVYLISVQNGYEELKDMHELNISFFYLDEEEVHLHYLHEFVLVLIMHGIYDNEEYMEIIHEQQLAFQIMHMKKREIAKYEFICIWRKGLHGLNMNIYTYMEMKEKRVYDTYFVYFMNKYVNMHEKEIKRDMKAINVQVMTYLQAIIVNRMKIMNSGLMWLVMLIMITIMNSGLKEISMLIINERKNEEILILKSLLRTNKQGEFVVSGGSTIMKLFSRSASKKECMKNMNNEYKGQNRDNERKGVPKEDV